MAREYRRKLSKNSKLSLQKKYADHLKFSRGGFLSTNRRKRLLELKLGEKSTPEADFWYKIKRYARDAIVDLQMICETANDNQIKEIFQSFPIKKTKKPNEPVDWSLFVSISTVLNSVLVFDWRSKETGDLWQTFLLKDIMNECLNYISLNGILMTKSHQRLIEEMRDLIDAIVGASSDLSPDQRRGVKF